MLNELHNIPAEGGRGDAVQLDCRVHKKHYTFYWTTRQLNSS